MIKKRTWHISKEEIARIFGDKKGIKNPMYGKHHSEETKEKIRQKAIGRKYIRSKEYCEKISQRFKGKKKSKESIEKMKATKRKGWKEGKYKAWNRGLEGEDYKKHFGNGFGGYKNKGKHPNPDFEFKKGQIAWNKGIPSPQTMGDKNPNWHGGIANLPYCYDWGRIRIKICERDNYVCQDCGKFGKHIHHIDYNKENNGENNLVCLCASCHSVTSATGDRKYWENYFKDRREQMSSKEITAMKDEWIKLQRNMGETMLPLANNAVKAISNIISEYQKRKLII